MCYKCERSDCMKSGVYKPNPNYIHMCYKCEQSGHMKLDFNKPDPNHIKICYKCEQSDHMHNIVQSYKLINSQS